MSDSNNLKHKNGGKGFDPAGKNSDFKRSVGPDLEGMCFEDSDPWDITDICKFIGGDAKFFHKYRFVFPWREYGHRDVNHPLDHRYAIRELSITYREMFFGLIRSHFRVLLSPPFNVLGICRHYEYETIYLPEKCDAYMRRLRLLNRLMIRRERERKFLEQSESPLDFWVEFEPDEDISREEEGRPEAMGNEDGQSKGIPSAFLDSGANRQKRKFWGRFK